MVTIAARFNGPDHSGNGGYVGGLLAEEHGGSVVTSTLRQPPPLDVGLSWERHGDELRLLTAGGAVVGSAVTGAFDVEPPAAPDAEEAALGLSTYPGFLHHPFSRCFTCGTHRDEGDALRLFTGPTHEDRTAGPWTVAPGVAGHDGVLDVPTTWAALDCPGGWAADFTRQVMVLGRMTAQVLRRPAAGEQLRSVGLLRRHEGRKFFTATALYSPAGDLLGRAEQTWIQVDPATF